MNTKSILVFLLLATSLSGAAEPSSFEIHAVADTPNATTKEYSLPKSNGQTQTVLLDSTVLLDGSALKSAKVTQGEDGNSLIEITFTESGAKRLGEITTAHAGKRVGFVLAGQLATAPVVKTPITGGSLVIEGNFTEKEAADLVAKINKSIRP